MPPAEKNHKCKNTIRTISQIDKQIERKTSNRQIEKQYNLLKNGGKT